MKTNFILLGIASIIVILVMSAKKKEAFREGQTIRYKSVAGGNRPAANPAAFKSFMSRTRPGRGYCERNIGSLWGFNNASVCRGGTNRNIARHIRIQFVEPQGRLWEVQAGVDAGNGGFIEVDGRRQVNYNADQWGGGQPQNSRLRFSTFISAGRHVMDIHYGEGCCDGRGHVRYRRSRATRGGGWGAWTSLTSASLTTLARQYRPPRPPPPPPRPRARRARGGACVTRDMVRVSGRWQDCCVRCGRGYSATSSRGDGGRCITCGVTRPPPPPPTCASFRCPAGYNRNTKQQCQETGCNLGTCCTRIPREEIKHCIKHLGWGKTCLKCDGDNGYKLSCGKDKCELIPIVEIPNCSKQRNWGKNCIKCNIGYKLANKNTQCDLIPIPNCKVQEHEVCLNCNEGWQPSPDGRKCDRIPVVDIKYCTKQRDWGKYCFECGDKNSGRTPSENSEVCDAIPIKHCVKQTEIMCEECDFGYKLSDNARKCDKMEIENCADQQGVICKECKVGYHMAEDRRACTLLPILNCDRRDEPPPKKPSAAEAKAAEEKKKEDEEQLRKQAMDPVKKVVGADFAAFAAAREQQQRDGFRSLFGSNFKANSCSGFGSQKLYSIC